MRLRETKELSQSPTCRTELSEKSEGIPKWGKTMELWIRGNMVPSIGLEATPLAVRKVDPDKERTSDFGRLSHLTVPLLQGQLGKYMSFSTDRVGSKLCLTVWKNCPNTGRGFRF